jgi:hypothetical protein
LTAPFLTPVAQRFLGPCGLVLLMQATVGLLRSYFHTAANLRGPATERLDNVIHGDPVLAPPLFPNLVLLASIGLWLLDKRLAAEHPPAPAARAGPSAVALERAQEP